MDYTQAQKDAARAYLIDNNVSNDKDTISWLKSIWIDANALNAQLQREKSAASQNSSPANNTTNPTSQSSSASTPTPAPVQRQESAPAPVQRGYMENLMGKDLNGLLTTIITPLKGVYEL